MIEGHREISADFLAKLLKSYKPPVDDPSRGIYIKNAEISGALNFERMTVPYWLVLDECTFKEDVYFFRQQFSERFVTQEVNFHGGSHFLSNDCRGRIAS